METEFDNADVSVCAKRYKTRPKHLFWKDSKGCVFKIEGIGKDMNLFEWKENGEKKGCYVNTYNITSDWIKITELEYNSTLPTA